MKLYNCIVLCMSLLQLMMLTCPKSSPMTMSPHHQVSVYHLLTTKIFFHLVTGGRVTIYVSTSLAIGGGCLGQMSTGDQGYKVGAQAPFISHNGVWF